MLKRSHRRQMNPNPKDDRSDRESRQSGQAPPRKQTACPLALEQLETRCLPSTLLPISLAPANQPPSDSAVGASTTPSVSADGRYVAFQSTALNLIPGQTGGTGNIFLLDRGTGTITLVTHIRGSATAAAGLPFDDSSIPIISRDGRYVVYKSSFSDEILGTMGGYSQVIVYDRTTGQNTLVSHSNTSMTEPCRDGGTVDAISSDGRYIVFHSTSNDLVPNQVTTPTQSFASDQLFVYDQTTHATLLVSHALGQNSVTANDGLAVDFEESNLNIHAISVADNGTIAYVSLATNLVAGTPGTQNVYLYSPSTQTNQLISTVSKQPTVGAGLCQPAAHISTDGSSVAYVSTASNLVPGQTGSNVANVFLFNTVRAHSGNRVFSAQDKV